MLKIHTTPTPYWTKVIEEARERVKRGEQAFTEGQIKKANDWVTCACGRQDDRIPREKLSRYRNGSYRGGNPLDGELYNRGVDFYVALKDYDVDRAEEALDAIELRAAQVLLGQKVGPTPP